MSVAFRSAKGRSFAERKATFPRSYLRRDPSCRSPLTPALSRWEREPETAQHHRARDAARITRHERPWPREKRGVANHWLPLLWERAGVRGRLREDRCLSRVTGRERRWPSARRGAGNYWPPLPGERAGVRGRFVRKAQPPTLRVRRRALSPEALGGGRPSPQPSPGGRGSQKLRTGRWRAGAGPAAPTPQPSPSGEGARNCAPAAGVLLRVLRHPCRLLERPLPLRRCAKINVAFRSAKGRSFAERKTTFPGSYLRRDPRCRSPLTPALSPRRGGQKLLATATDWT